ncbi:MAG: aminopeptidase P family protein [Leptospiraceae bacterium]|nr:aminopeptidase P family protein [Leptospiraceae bacterium]MDW7975910.1 aminopeptidase P family protein [Leptospiraceae bacterium]
MMAESKINWQVPRKLYFPIPKEELQQRISRLQNFLDRNSVCVVISAIPTLSYDSIYYRFRQNTDFFYLTGLEISPAALIITPENVILFYNEPKSEDEIWTGVKPNHQEIRSYLEFIENVYPYDSFKVKLFDFLENKKRVYFPFGVNEELDRYFFQNLEYKIRRGRANVYFPTRIFHSYELFFELRIKKSEYEIQEIQSIMEITKEGFYQVWKNLKTCQYEYELESILIETYKKHDAQPAYPPIVAQGENACILHYVQNRDKLNPQNLILIDSGASKHYLNTDITRTFPKSGKFISIQKMLYEVVLEAQRKAIEVSQIGSCFEDVHYSALLVLIDFLKQEKILQGSIEEIIVKELYKPYFMHRIGHWLGYDVHDKGFYLFPFKKKHDRICRSQYYQRFHQKPSPPYRKFEENMILTIEPGLYFSHGLEVPEEWKGIGIRIEDNILISKGVPRVLSESIPKTIPELENLIES